VEGKGGGGEGKGLNYAPMTKNKSRRLCFLHSSQLTD
jgi:hypothetical protein